MVNYDESNPDSGSFVLNWQPEDESTKKIKTGDVYTMKLVSRTGATLAGNFDWQVTAMRNGSRHRNGSDTGGYGKKIANEPIVIRVVVKKPNSSWQIQKIFKQKIKDIIVQEYWDHYPYKGSNGAYIECIAASAMASATKPPRCGAANFYEIPTVSSFIPATYTDTYTKAGVWNNCDESCAEMISANYKDADVTIKGSGFTFVDLVNIKWNQYMQTWYATNPDVEPLYRTNLTYKAWVQSIWRNPERQESSSSVINSAHQFGVGVDFSHKNSFGDGRPIYVYQSDRSAANICLLAWSAWDSGGTR